MSESDLMLSIRKRLSLYQTCGEVEWFLRINSGKIYHNGNYIQLAPKGTPDWFVLVRNKAKGITAIFLEAKSESGTQTPEQKEFQAKYHNIPDIYYYVIRNIGDLGIIINELAFDFITLLPEDL